MPELPEVQTVVDGLNSVAGGKVIERLVVHWPGYIQGISPEKLETETINQRFISASRRGKYILIRLERNYLILHLRMTGSVLNLDPDEERTKHTHAEMFFKSGLRLGFSDVRKFGRLEYVLPQKIESRIAKMNLGPEPLESGFTPEPFWENIRKSDRPVKNILLDQKIVAGLGNIYVCEILFQSGISPFKKGKDINLEEADVIVRHTKEILAFAISKGGSSIRDYVNVDGKTGGMQNHFDVYGRAGEACTACGATLEKEKQAGRSTFFCPFCQK